MNTKRQRIAEAATLLSDEGHLSFFISKLQRRVMVDALRGEEGEYFADLVHEIKARIEGMPKTYETEGRGAEAKVVLHYFKGGTDAWISEKDVGVPFDDGTHDHTQAQAFGKLCILPNYPEVGYIPIHSLIAHGAELDLYWDSETRLKDLK
jgi:hypothetical protein